MDIQPIISELVKNKFIFQSLFEKLTPEIYTWRENETKWNLLEVLCHLYDEEREDFRTRVKSTLENPTNELPPIDPQGWVNSRKYSEQDFDTKLEEFLEERVNSIEWLMQLHEPNWDNEYVHHKFGRMSAGLFLTNWLAHDYLHIRQIIRIKYNYFKETSGENFDYAGEW